MNNEIKIVCKKKINCMSLMLIVYVSVQIDLSIYKPILKKKT